MLDMYLLSYVYISYLFCFVKRISNTDQAPFVQLYSTLCIHGPRAAATYNNIIICTIIFFLMCNIFLSLHGNISKF